MEAADRKFRRLHPLTLVHRAGAATLAFVLMITSNNDFSIVILIFTVVYAVVLAPWLIAQYIRFTYHVSEREIFINSGVFSHVRRNIPVGRIQNVAIERNILARLLGTAAVKIETAGSTAAEGVLAYVGLAEAHRIRTLLRSGAAHAMEENTLPAAASAPDFAMSIGRVLLSGVYQFSLGYFVLVFAIFGQAQQFGIFGPEEITNWLFGDMAEAFIGRLLEFPLLVGIAIALIAVLLGWVTGIVVNLFRHYNFRLELRTEKIYRCYGLTTLREGTLPYGRVQSLLICSNPLMRLRQWFRLEMQTLGFEGGHYQGFQLAMPFAKWNDVMALAPRICSFSLPDSYESVANVTVRRMGLRYSLALVVLVGTVYLFWKPAIWGLGVMPLLWVLALLQYWCHGWAFVDENLVIRRGAIRQRLWIVPAERFQAFQTSATFFQRQLGVCSLTVDTAGAGILRRPKIIDLHTETANLLTHTLYDVFQSTTSPSHSATESRSLL